MIVGRGSATSILAVMDDLGNSQHLESPMS
mgnify:CR=1 FL=1